MMRRWLKLSALSVPISVLGVITLLHFPTFASQQLANQQTGLRILSSKTPHRWQGDFDSDGKPDILSTVQINSNFQASPQQRLLNFWDTKPFLTPIPLAFSLKNSRDRQEFLIYSAGYFQSPLWQQPRLPIRIVQRGTAEHGRWQQQVKAFKGDGIVLGTEAGIDTLLYWDGRSYRIYFPPEQP
jgi:hypothetical protein